jgi:hypothetical protein
MKGGKNMPKYRVVWSEVGFYDQIIEAKDAQEAEIIWNGECHDGEIEFIEGEGEKVYYK